MPTYYNRVETEREIPKLKLSVKSSISCKIYAVLRINAKAETLQIACKNFNMVKRQ